MEKIESLKNDKIKQLYKLKNNKKEIISKKLFLIEGKNIINEALKNNLIIELLVENLDQYKNIEIKKTLVTKEIIKKLSSNSTNNGIIGVCKYKENNNFIKKIKDFKKVVVLDNINNPGNLGTIIRTAKAFNYDAIFLINNSVFKFNDKVIKSSQGEVLNFNVFDVKIEQIEKYFFPIFFLLDRNKSIEINELKESFKRPFALVFGNEANGISNSLIKKWNGKKVFIKMENNVDSLNLSISAGIAMFKFK